MKEGRQAERGFHAIRIGKLRFLQYVDVVFSRNPPLCSVSLSAASATELSEQLAVKRR